MRTIQNMIDEIQVLKHLEANTLIPIADFISSYVNTLSSDEIYFALEGLPIQELLEFINQTPIGEELCCGFHYAQCIIKCLLLYSVIDLIHAPPQINILDDFSG
jgi:hypothetical protein